MRLYAVTMTGDTNDPANSVNKGMGRAVEQINAMEAEIEKAWTAISSHMQKAPKPFWQALFIAPEYYFSNSRYQNDRFYSKEVKKYIVSRLHAVAKKHPSLLIVPGTILWRKAAYTEETFDIASGKLTLPSPKNESRYKKTLDRLSDAYYSFDTDANKPGWSHSGKWGRTDSSVTWEQSNYMPDFYLKNAKALDTQIAQNVAYIFMGNVVLKYHKVGNFREVWGESSNIVFAPGNISGLFTVGSVQYGIEICRDHCMEVLKKSGKTVSIQIIISSYIPNIPNAISLAAGGVLIHSSTQKTKLADNVDQIQLADKSATNLVASQKVGNSQLWVIDMDDAKANLTDSHAKLLTSNTLSAAAHV